MKILVTGHTGFVGGAIASYLVEQGHDVFGVSRRLTGNREWAGEYAIDLGDRDAPAHLQECIPCDAVVHAAASLSKDPFDSSVTLVNGCGTQALLSAAVTWGASRFIYISGVPVIGMPRQLPVDERHQTQPLTAYHASKLYGEHLVDIACRAGLPGISLRLTSPVGRGMPDNRIFSTFVRHALENKSLRIMGQGGRVQNYIDMRDLVPVVLVALASRRTGVFNIAGAQSISNRDLANTCIRVVNSSAVIEETGQPDPEEEVRWDISIDQAVSELGYCPVYSIESSIKAVAEMYADRIDQ